MRFLMKSMYAIGLITLMLCICNKLFFGYTDVVLTLASIALGMLISAYLIEKGLAKKADNE